MAHNVCVTYVPVGNSMDGKKNNNINNFLYLLHNLKNSVESFKCRLISNASWEFTTY